MVNIMCNITMYKYTDWIGLPYFSGCTHRFSVQKWEDPLGELGVNVAPLPQLRLGGSWGGLVDSNPLECAKKRCHEKTHSLWSFQKWWMMTTITNHSASPGNYLWNLSAWYSIEAYMYIYNDSSSRILYSNSQKRELSTFPLDGS